MPVYYVIFPSLFRFFFLGQDMHFIFQDMLIPIIEMYIVSYFIYKYLQKENIFEIFNDISFCTDWYFL